MIKPDDQELTANSKDKWGSTDIDFPPFISLQICIFIMRKCIIIVWLVYYKNIQYSNKSMNLKKMSMETVKITMFYFV